jgi:hypothetical protein
MEALLSIPVFLGFAFVAIVAFALLGKTPVFWLPGLAVIAYGVAIYVAWPWYDTHHSNGFEGLSNLLHVAVTGLVVAAGCVCVILGARSRRRARVSSADRAA